MAMKWSKAPAEVSEAFDAALPGDALVQRRQMFGYPAAFVNGNMFAGVWQSHIVLRLPEPKRAEIIETAGAEPFVPMGRAMREYVIAPPAMLTDREALALWLNEAFRFGAALPLKEAKPRRKKQG